MGDNTSPYVDFNRAWIVKEAIAKFLRASNLSREVSEQFNKGNKDIYQHFVVLSELLWDIRDQLFLIYKRPIGPNKSEFEKALKYTPTPEFMQFVNIVGLLFHKVLIARELCYTTEFYESDKPENNLKFMLKDYIKRIDELFKTARELVLPFISSHTTDAVVLCYLIENASFIQSSLDKDLKNILKQLDIPGGIEKAFEQVVEFCYKNGWDDRAEKVLQDGLKVWPKSKKLLALQHAVK